MDCSTRHENYNDKTWAMAPKGKALTMTMITMVRVGFLARQKQRGMAIAEAGAMNVSFRSLLASPSARMNNKM